MGCVMLQSGQLHAWLDSLDARLLPSPLLTLLHLLAVSLAALSRCACWPSWHRKIVVESDDSAAFWLHAKASTAQLMTQALQLSACVCVCALVRVCALSSKSFVSVCDFEAWPALTKVLGMLHAARSLPKQLWKVACWPCTSPLPR